MSFGDLLNVLWILFILSAIIPAIQRTMLEAQRRATIHAIERKRGSRLITLIHRQESLSILGIPISRYINIEDSERVLRAIRLTDQAIPIDIVLHTPGGLVLAAEQIAFALCRHKAKVTVFIPHYAMSGGTLIAVAAHEIVMDPNSVLGPVDPQLGIAQEGYYPAASILAAAAVPNPNRSDSTLIMADMARKAIAQVFQMVYRLLKSKGMDEESAEKLARTLSEGRWTHDYPIMAGEARELGLPVSEEMPTEIYQLMDLYPQAAQRRPSVEFIPTPYRPAPPERPSGRHRP